MHTPGPWKWVDTLPSKHRITARRLISAEETVLQATSSSDVVVGVDDARLIECAPEMYEALVELIITLNDAQVPTTNQRVRALGILAKVRGEQQ